jgi:hypothetical protein
MKVLFSVSSFGFLRNFQSTIRLLAERGHAIHLIAERTDAIDGQKMVDGLKADHPSIKYEFVPSTRHRLWYALGTGVRAALDYWRYLDARWDQSPKLRHRAAEQAPGFAVAVANLPLLGTRAGLAALIRLFHAIDRVLPPPAEVTAAGSKPAPTRPGISFEVANEPAPITPNRGFARPETGLGPRPAAGAMVGAGACSYWRTTPTVGSSLRRTPKASSARSIGKRCVTSSPGFTLPSATRSRNAAMLRCSVQRTCPIG